ncbi:gephyrin-like molybdotransferase Glp [Aquamicrobium segne]|uniref:Molybdopterin molybdenumtransferase n=1 Tax=Aquamicrobium segne TaxID=469547 RepID=A0ABW0H1D9_9HYPH
MDTSFGKNTISVKEARHLINCSMRLTGTQELALPQAHGRVLANAVEALTQSPPFDVSAMDGYAVLAADVPEAGVVLPMSGASKAGVAMVPTLQRGTCMRIFTGAPVPHGANAIIIQEDVEAKGRQISFNEVAIEGLHIRKAGLNFSKGEQLAEKGHLLTARDIGLLAAAGHASVAVFHRPRIAVLSTGDEVAASMADAASGQIVDANRPALLALIRAWGGEAIDLGIAGDDDAAIVSALDGLEADLLLVTGGASVGEHDRVRPVLQALGLRFDFWKIRMRPGKPLMFGTLGAMPVLGLPGNPVSALVCSLLFLKPAISVMTGGEGLGPEFENARLMEPIDKTGNRDDYLRAMVEMADGALAVRVFAQQDSSMLAVLARANAFLFRPAGAPPADAGEMVKVIRLNMVPGY